MYIYLRVNVVSSSGLICDYILVSKVLSVSNYICCRMQLLVYSVIVEIMQSLYILSYRRKKYLGCYNSAACFLCLTLPSRQKKNRMPRKLKRPNEDWCPFLSFVLWVVRVFVCFVLRGECASEFLRLHESNPARLLVKFKIVRHTFTDRNSLSCPICTESINLPLFPCIMCMYYRSVMFLESPSNSSI